VSDQSERKVAW